MKTNYAKPEEVEACKRWLKAVQAKTTQTIRRNRGSSYGLKHDVERWLCSDANSEEGMYISEHSFIEAMRDTKFRLEPVDKSETEPSSFCFNISYKG